MSSFNFPFTYQNLPYTATCEIIHQTPDTLFQVMADDKALQTQFGTYQKITRDTNGNYTRGLPRFVGGRDFIDALYEGFRTFQEANPQYA